MLGEYLVNAQGEDVVAGVRTPNPIAKLKEDMPGVYDQFMDIANTLEKHYKDMQDMEFTIEEGKLFFLQTRNGKRTANAALRIAVEMVDEGLITTDEALLRVEPKQLDQLLHPAFDQAALKAAKAHGLTVSVDLNFRKKLWSQEKAREVMTNLMQYVDICIGNEEDAEKVLGFKPEGSDVMSGNLELSGYMNIFGQMADRFGFRYIASSLRESHSASNNGWSACIMDGKTKEFYHSRKYTIAPIVDRVGGGDAFTSGLICGLLDGKEMKDALEFGTAAAALKHTIPGDVNLMTRAEVEKLAGGDSSGRVQR